MRINRGELARLMAENDMSVKQLSELSGVHIQTLSAIKGGKTCREETAEKIANALNIPLKKLEQQKRIS